VLVGASALACQASTCSAPAAPGSGSVTPTTVSTPGASPTTASPTPNAGGLTPAASAPGAASAEQLADLLKSALEGSDYARVADLVTRGGWTGGYYQGEGTPHLSPQETIDWLRTRAKQGRLNVSVEARPLLPRQSFQPAGELYVRSVWRDFDNVVQQNVDLLLHDEAGRWFWSGALFRAPR